MRHCIQRFLLVHRNRQVSPLFLYQSLFTLKNLRLEGLWSVRGIWHPSLDIPLPNPVAMATPFSLSQLQAKYLHRKILTPKFAFIPSLKSLDLCLDICFLSITPSLRIPLGTAIRDKSLITKSRYRTPYPQFFTSS